ncbi:MAG: hypothetical protein AB7L90_19175 [Hyphomicrobiaceae bacterium]
MCHPTKRVVRFDDYLVVIEGDAHDVAAVEVTVDDCVPSPATSAPDGTASDAPAQRKAAARRKGTAPVKIADLRLVTLIEKQLPDNEARHAIIDGIRERRRD